MQQNIVLFDILEKLNSLTLIKVSLLMMKNAQYTQNLTIPCIYIFLKILRNEFHIKNDCQEQIHRYKILIKSHYLFTIYKYCL